VALINSNKAKFYFFILILAIVSSCFHPAIKPIFPEDISDKRRNEYIPKFNDGKKIYKANCSVCHGLFHKGKVNVRNFSKQQLNAYTAQLSMQDSTNHSAAKNLSENELNNLLIFLHYLKRDNDTK
jgi:cytochrome c553